MKRRRLIPPPTGWSGNCRGSKPATPAPRAERGTGPRRVYLNSVPPTLVIPSQSRDATRSRPRRGVRGIPEASPFQTPRGGSTPSPGWKRAFDSSRGSSPSTVIGGQTDMLKGRVLDRRQSVLQMRLDDVLNARFGLESYQAFLDLTTDEEDQTRNAHHPEAHGGLRAFVDV